MLYIDQIPSRNPVRFDYHIGSRGPSYCSGTGKAWLAFLEPTERRTRIERLTRSARLPFQAREERLDRPPATIRG